MFWIPLSSYFSSLIPFHLLIDISEGETWLWSMRPTFPCLEKGRCLWWKCSKIDLIQLRNSGLWPQASKRSKAQRIQKSKQLEPAGKKQQSSLGLPAIASRYQLILKALIKNGLAIDGMADWYLVYGKSCSNISGCEKDKAVDTTDCQQKV